MAQIVLENFPGNGFQLPAGEILEDTDGRIPELQAAGAPMRIWNDSAAENTARNAFLNARKVRGIYQVPSMTPYLSQSDLTNNAIADTQDYCIDEPIVLGNRVTAQPTKTHPCFQRYHLRSFYAWSALGAGAGTITIRIWRYRRLTSGSGFSYLQITDSFVYDSAQPYSFFTDMSANIRAGDQYDLAPNDVLAVGRVTAGPGSLVNLTLKWDLTPLEGTVTGAVPNELEAWPPTPDD